jgi:hypothetical protein
MLCCKLPTVHLLTPVPSGFVTRVDSRDHIDYFGHAIPGVFGAAFEYQAERKRSDRYGSVVQEQLNHACLEAEREVLDVSVELEHKRSQIEAVAYGPDQKQFWQNFIYAGRIIWAQHNASVLMRRFIQAVANVRPDLLSATRTLTSVDRPLVPVSSFSIAASPSSLSSSVSSNETKNSRASLPGVSSPLSPFEAGVLRSDGIQKIVQIATAPEKNPAYPCFADLMKIREAASAKRPTEMPGNFFDQLQICNEVIHACRFQNRLHKGDLLYHAYTYLWPNVSQQDALKHFTLRDGHWVIGPLSDMMFIKSLLDGNMDFVAWDCDKCKARNICTGFFDAGRLKSYCKRCFSLLDVREIGLVVPFFAPDYMSIMASGNVAAELRKLPDLSPCSMTQLNSAMFGVNKSKP